MTNWALPAVQGILRPVQEPEWLLGTSNETDCFSLRPIDFKVLEILLTFPDHTIKMQTEFLADTIHLYMWGMAVHLLLHF